jgi:hypothetical protein
MIMESAGDTAAAPPRRVVRSSASSDASSSLRIVRTMLRLVRTRHVVRLCTRCPDPWLSSSVGVAAELSVPLAQDISLRLKFCFTGGIQQWIGAAYELSPRPIAADSEVSMWTLLLARTIAWLSQPRRARAERWSGRSGRGLETARPSALVTSLSRLGLCALLVKSLGGRDALAPGGKAGARQARLACSDDEPTTNAWQRPDQVFELQFVGRACRFVRLSGCVVRPCGGRCAAASLEIWVRSRTACSTTISLLVMVGITHCVARGRGSGLCGWAVVMDGAVGSGPRRFVSGVWFARRGGRLRFWGFRRPGWCLDRVVDGLCRGDRAGGHDESERVGGPSARSERELLCAGEQRVDALKR